MQYPIEPLVLTHHIDFIAPETYLPLIDTIREVKKEKINKFRFTEDKLRCLSGELLLKYALYKYFKIEYEKEPIKEDEFGKPYLANKQIFFNISHSGNWAVAVCYVNEAGIDIEKIEKPPYEIMTDNFTRKEIEQIEDSEPLINAEKFYKMWTLKESYIKMIGKGLSIPLDCFSIDIRDENKISVIDTIRLSTDVNFRLFRPDHKHIMAVCLRNYNKEILPCEVPFNELKV